MIKQPRAVTFKNIECTNTNFASQNGIGTHLQDDLQYQAQNE